MHTWKDLTRTSARFCTWYDTGPKEITVRKQTCYPCHIHQNYAKQRYVRQQICLPYRKSLLRWWNYNFKGTELANMARLSIEVLSDRKIHQFTCVETLVPFTGNAVALAAYSRTSADTKVEHAYIISSLVNYFCCMGYVAVLTFTRCISELTGPKNDLSALRKHVQQFIWWPSLPPYTEQNILNKDWQFSNLLLHVNICLRDVQQASSAVSLANIKIEKWHIDIAFFSSIQTCVVSDSKAYAQKWPHTLRWELQR